jgi:hypothetical protein
MSNYDDHEKQVSTKGEPRVGHPHEEGPAAGPIDTTGMHEAYWVLSEEERAKGFVRPVRASYKHVGMRPQGETRPLTEEEHERYDKFNYVAYEPYGPEKNPSTGRFWTQEQLDSGCGRITTMGHALAETYARDPKFYGATYCATCKQHFAVSEFIWWPIDFGGKPQVVGS